MGGDGNDITLTRTDVPQVPLPASAWLLVAGLAGLAAGTRRKTAA
jgi:hypothetical protein